MGQGAEDADIAGTYWGDCNLNFSDDRERYEEKRARKAAKSRVRFESSAAAKAKAKIADRNVHRPATDTEARDLILRLDHFEWETHKVSGRFDRNPYTLTATIDGQAHRIKLPGRFGGVLKWLDREERKRHVQEIL